MSGALDVRPYRAGDEVAIQRGFQEVFGQDRDLETWRWKFEGPREGSIIELGFDAGGDLLAQYSAIALAVRWDGRRARAGQIVDVFSRHARGLARRAGPFLATADGFFARCRRPDGLGFVYGFPGERHQRLGRLVGLYHATSPIEKMTAAVAPRRAVRWWRSWLSEGFDAAAIDRLWERSRHRYPRAVVRDGSWARWRYAEKPHGGYRQIVIRRAGVPRAWGVLDGSRPVARWLDLVWDGERAGDLERLDGEIREIAAAAGAERLDLWLRGDSEAREILARAGWKGEEEPILRLGAISFDERWPVEAIYGSFYLTMGDCDHF